VQARFFPKGTGHNFNNDNYGIMLFKLPDFKSWVVDQPELIEAGMRLSTLPIDKQNVNVTISTDKQKHYSATINKGGETKL
jgi:hypothetical protein